ncbi:MAG: MFS transporter [Synechocystis sp.]|nr:MFS transporter [Synechocystis sp.]
MNSFKTLRQLKPETQKTFALLFASVLLFWLSLTSLLPTLPMYAQDAGATRQEVGWIMGSFAVGLLGSRVWIGQLVDRQGRKIALLIGALVVATAPLGYLLTEAVIPLMGVRAFHGICIAAYTTGYNALVVDLSPPQQRGELVSYMSLAIPLGMGFGPAGGAYIAQTAGYQTLFYLSALLGFLSLLLAFQVKEPKASATPSKDQQKDPTEQASLPRSMGELISSQSLLIPTLVLLLIGLLFGNLATFLPLFVREINLGTYAGLFYSTAAIASFLPRILLGPISDRLGRGVFITASLFCYLLSMTVLAQADTPLELLTAAVLEGGGSGVLIPMTIALISDRSTFNERGRVFAVCMSGFDGGIAIAAPMMGILNENFGFRTVFWLTGGLAIAALLLFLTLSNPTLSRSLKFAIGRGKDSYAVAPGNN